MLDLSSHKILYTKQFLNEQKSLFISIFIIVVTISKHV